MTETVIRDWQKAAVRNHCRLAIETTHPRFRHLLYAGHITGPVSVVLTVNSGYE